MDPWRWSSARTGLIAWEDAILCIGRAVQADLAVTCPTRGGPRGEIMRRNMNKGAVEFFSKGKCRRCELRRRGGEEGRSRPRTGSKESVLRLVMAPSMNASAWNNPGPIKGHGTGGSRLPERCYRGSRMLGISWASDLYIYPLPGSLPVGPCPSSSIFAKDEQRIASNLLQLCATCFDLESTWRHDWIQFFLFSFCNISWMEQEMKYERW